ncbi:hypothetical protein ACYZT3_04805 [Pseudomonas sp. MDT1-16]
MLAPCGRNMYSIFYLVYLVYLVYLESLVLGSLFGPVFKLRAAINFFIFVFGVNVVGVLYKFPLCFSSWVTLAIDSNVSLAAGMVPETSVVLINVGDGEGTINVTNSDSNTALLYTSLETCLKIRKVS